MPRSPDLLVSVVRTAVEGLRNLAAAAGRHSGRRVVVGDRQEAEEHRMVVAGEELRTAAEAVGTVPEAGIDRQEDTVLRAEDSGRAEEAAAGDMVLQLEEGNALAVGEVDIVPEGDIVLGEEGIGPAEGEDTGLAAGTVLGEDTAGVVEEEADRIGRLRRAVGCSKTSAGRSRFWPLICSLLRR